MARFAVPADEAEANQKRRAGKAAGSPLPLMRLLKEDPLPSGLEVIVIGAGVSGLHAALQLERLGAKVTVIEGRPRIGGRIRTETIGEGQGARRVDLGASFVCGTSRSPPLNPTFQYACGRLDLSLAPKQRSGRLGNAWFDDDGTSIDYEKQIAGPEKDYERILDALKREGEKCSTRELTVDKAMEKMLKRPDLQLTPHSERIVRCYMSDLYVAPLDQISLRGAISWGYDGDHELVLGGYHQVAEALRQGKAPDDPGYEKPLADVRLEHRVTKVELPQPVGRPRVTVRKADGAEEVLTAHAVLVTVPLGVLQRGAIEFSPPLPPYKQSAIRSLGMGTENRVAMVFPSVFWPENVHFLRPISGRYTFNNLHALGVKNVLNAWVRPHAVEEVERMTDAEALEDVLALLRRMFPETFVPPTAHKVTRWSRDEFSYGSYSYVPPTGSKTDYDRLAVRTRPRVRWCLGFVSLTILFICSV